MTSIYHSKAADFIKDRIHGSGVDLDWVVEDNSRSTRLINSYHCMDENGYYDGWADFVIILPKHSTDLVTDFVLQFTSRTSRYMNRKYQLRDYLEQLVAETLIDMLCEDECIAEKLEDGGTGV